MNTTQSLRVGFARQVITPDYTVSISGYGDNETRMALIKFAREEKTDIVMMNWQAHNDNAKAVGYHFISSSYVGRLRTNSPFDTTFILTGNSGYLPCAEAYDYRSYEADTSIFAKGTAEKVADELVRMLNDVR